MIDDKSLDTELGRIKAPAPNTDLSARIMSAAQQTPQTQAAANDRPISWGKFGTIAACLIAVSVVSLQIWGPNSDVDQWEMAADNAGFADVYDWVYAEDSKS